MMPLIRIEVTPAPSGIFIKRAGIGGPKTTALQSLSRRYSGVLWFSVKRRRADLVHHEVQFS